MLRRSERLQRKREASPSAKRVHVFLIPVHGDKVLLRRDGEPLTTETGQNIFELAFHEGSRPIVVDYGDDMAILAVRVSRIKVDGCKWTSVNSIKIDYLRRVARDSLLATNINEPYCSY